MAPATAAINLNWTIVTTIVNPAAIPTKPATNPVKNPAAYTKKNLLGGVK